MTERVRVRLIMWAAVYAGCMFTVSLLARAVRPGGGWATYLALVFLAVAGVALIQLIRLSRCLFPDDGEKLEADQ